MRITNSLSPNQNPILNNSTTNLYNMPYTTTRASNSNKVKAILQKQLTTEEYNNLALELGDNPRAFGRRVNNPTRWRAMDVPPLAKALGVDLLTMLDFINEAATKYKAELQAAKANTTPSNT
jgi:hypothetical protein